MRTFAISLAIAATFAATAPQPVLADGVSGSYLAARSALRTGDFTAAADYFGQALVRDAGNAEIMEQLLRARLSLGQAEAAQPVATLLEESGHRSQLAHMLRIPALLRDGAFDDVIARIDGDRGVGRLVDGLVRGWAELGAGRVAEALSAFDIVAEERGLRGFALYHKALALASVGDYEAAEEIYEGDAAVVVVATRRGAMARLEILSQLGREADALTFLEDSFGTDLDPELKAMQAALVAGETLPFTHVRSPQDGAAEVFFAIASALDREAEPEYTLLYARLAEYLRPDHVDAVLLSARLLESMGRYQLASKAYRQVPETSDAYHAAELGRADSLRKAGKTDAAIEVLETLAHSHGELPLVHATLGDLLAVQEQYGEAVAAYNRALSLYSEQTERQWFLHYALAKSEERRGNWSAAEAAFRRALELTPGQPQVLNYLGYSLVERQEKLDEALAMIEEAVAARPDAGYIVDSLGWALFRLGRYDEAVGHLEHAAELMPVDPVVNDHLGDVLWAVGRTMEAEFQWNRALSFVPEDFNPEDIDPERIRRKLEVGLDAVLRQEGADPLEVAQGGGD